jgi:hypothetical protein
MISINEFKNGSKNLKTEAVVSNDNISVLFSKLFESRSFAHYCHLRSDSYAQHKALGKFYENIIDLADKLYETYAGQYGQIKFDAGCDIKESDVVKYFENLGKMVSESHSMIKESDTHIHNILDEITGLVYQTTYKLKFLK